MTSQTSSDAQLCAVCLGPLQTPVSLSCTQRHVVCLLCAQLKAKTAHAKSNVMDETEARRFIEKFRRDNAEQERDEHVGAEDGALASFPCPSCREAVGYDLAHDTLGLDVVQAPPACVNSDENDEGDESDEAVCDGAPGVRKRSLSLAACSSSSKRMRLCVGELELDAGAIEAARLRARVLLAECAEQCHVVDVAHVNLAARLRELYTTWCATKTSVNMYFDDLVRRVEDVRAAKLAELEALWRTEHALYESQIGVLGSARAVLRETISTAQRGLSGEVVVQRVASIVSQLEEASSLGRGRLEPVMTDEFVFRREDFERIVPRVDGGVRLRPSRSNFCFDPTTLGSRTPCEVSADGLIIRHIGMGPLPEYVYGSLLPNHGRHKWRLRLSGGRDNGAGSMQFGVATGPPSRKSARPFTWRTDGRVNIGDEVEQTAVCMLNLATTPEVELTLDSHQHTLTMRRLDNDQAHTIHNIPRDVYLFVGMTHPGSATLL